MKTERSWIIIIWDMLGVHYNTDNKSYNRKFGAICKVDAQGNITKACITLTYAPCKLAKFIYHN